MVKRDTVIETTMSELLLSFLDTEEGKIGFQQVSGENWQEELIRFREELVFKREHTKENKIIIKIGKEKQ